MLLVIDCNDVAVAYDGLTALQRAEEFRPDVVLLGFDQHLVKPLKPANPYTALAAG